jgi:phytoene/squalene synthetase
LTDCIQDVASDYLLQNRIYMPQEDWASCGFQEDHLIEQETPNSLLKLLHLQSQRAEFYLQNSLSSPHNMKGLAGLQLRLCQSGCATILERCRQRTNHREVPRLKKKDWMLLLWHSL